MMPVRARSGEMERKGLSEVPVAYHFTQRLQEEENVRSKTLWEGLWGRLLSLWPATFSFPSLLKNLASP